MLYFKPAAEFGNTIHMVLLYRFAEYKLKVMEAILSFQKTTKARQCVTLRSFVKMERWSLHFVRDLWMLEMQRPWEICKKGCRHRVDLDQETEATRAICSINRAMTAGVQICH